MRYYLLLTALLSTLCMTGCLFVAPIDEESEPVDELPYIDTISGVTPGMGLVNINLSQGGEQEFIISSYGDDNSEQTLYHRIVIDYRSADVYTNPVYAIVPKQVHAHARERISYKFSACTAALSYPDAIADGKTINLYIVIADEPFAFQNQLFTALNFTQPFETSTEHPDRSVWVQWTLLFKGTCPKD